MKKFKLTKLKGLKKWQKLLIIAGVFALCFIWWIIWGNLSLEATQYTITSDRIPDAFDGFRIVQISDLHNAQFGEDNSLLLEKIREQKPDIIVITGDFVDSYHPNADIAVSFARQVVELSPVYYVTGNHEHRIGYKNICRQLEDVGVMPLLNARVMLSRGEDQLALLGVLDTSLRESPERENTLNDLMPTDGSYTVLLAHRPECFDSYVHSGVDLAFTGHVHGGQFRLPFIGGLYAPGQGIFPKYDAGLITEGQTNMIISRGIGPSRFPFRLNNRPEIVVVTLKKG